MNTSPYDNLPVGVREPKQENQQQQENLQYVDVPLHQLASGASGKTAQPQGTAEEGAAGEITLPEVSPQQKEDAATGEMAMTSDTRSETAPPESFEGSQEDEINETDETDTPSETEAVESSDSTESDVKNPPEYSSSIADEHSNALPIKSNGKDVPEDDIVTNDAAGNRALEVAPEKSKALESVSEKNGTAGALPKDHPSRESGRDSGRSDAFSRSSWYSKSFLKNITGAGEHLFPFEETLLVPDTMPDMDKVLFAEGSVLLSQPGKTSYRRSDGISGQIIVYTVYKPGDNSSSPVDVIRSAVPFKADDCWDDPESDTFRISLSIKSISAEMLNERKFIVKGTVSIRYTGISQKELMVFDGTGDADLICRTGTIKAANLIFEADETTEISQEVNIREGQPAPVKVLKERFDIVENHRQITSGKLVINGTIISEVLYLGQDEDGSSTLASLRNKTDFTQFIIADEDVDADLLQISFINDGLKATIENQNRFLLQGKVTSVICGYENMDVPIVSDAYHKKHDIAFDISGTSVSCLEGTVCGEVSSREIVNIEEETGKPDTLLCGSGRITEIRGTAERGRITIDGSIAVEILALDEEGNPLVIDSQVPLRGALEMAEASDESTADISASLKEFWFDSINPRQLEINVSVSIEVRAIGRENFTTIDSLRFVESESPRKHISMALYVAGRGDTMWDIAKRYKTDEKTLSRLNGIDDSSLSEGTKLLIMK